MNGGLRGRYLAVLERLDAACAAAGRPRGSVRLVAVSKFHDAAAVAEVARAGQTDFGESYAQEALAKMADPLLAALPLRWHFIGHVQRRKAGDVAGAFACVHSLDSTRLAGALERRLASDGSRQAVLVQVNLGEEPQKFGVAPADLPQLADYVLERCPHLEMRGLMCLPPVFDAGEAARPHFARLREMRDALSARLGLPLPELSMGMSGDFVGAVAEGATMVRIGTDIFGPRPARPGQAG